MDLNITTAAETTTTMKWFWNNCVRIEGYTLMYYVERFFTFPISFIGFVLHIIAIIVAVRVQKRSPVQVSHMIFLMSLLVDDMIFAFSDAWHFGFRKFLYEAIHGDAIYMVDMRQHETITFFLFATTTKTWHSFRNLIIGFLAFERFIVVTWPLRAKQICNKRNANIILVITIIVSLLRLQWGLYVGNLWVWELNPCSGKWQLTTDTSPGWPPVFWNISDVDYYLHFITALFLPVILTGVMNIGLFISIKKIMKNRSKLISNMSVAQVKEQNKTIRSARSVLILSIFFFILQAPQAVDRVMSLLQLGKTQLVGFMTVARNFADALTALDLTVDFITIILLNSKYFQELKALLTCRSQN